MQQNFQRYEDVNVRNEGITLEFCAGIVDKPVINTYFPNVS